MDKDKILIEVYGGTNQGCASGCSGCGQQFGCGTSTPTDKMVERLAEELNTGYGDKVEIRYIDTDQSGIKDFPVISQIIKAGYPFPITVIDGKPRLAGSINLEMIKQLLNI